jgi:hypothetical protein
MTSITSFCSYFVLSLVAKVAMKSFVLNFLYNIYKFKWPLFGSYNTLIQYTYILR